MKDASTNKCQLVEQIINALNCLSYLHTKCNTDTDSDIDFLKGHSIVALLKITMNLSDLFQIIQKLPKIHTCKFIICYDDGR